MPADYAIRIETINPADIKVIHGFTSFFNSTSQCIALNAYAEDTLYGIVLFFDKLIDLKMFHEFYYRIGEEMKKKLEKNNPLAQDREVLLDITLELLPPNSTIEDDLSPVVDAAYNALPEGILLDPQSDNLLRLH
ncbi:MAG TPA: hypothetical protein VKK79_14070, partial [Candidatus Lokiarchaeia archaeon]|nr:hypothetical protein [Candidatus Lokiarchaeia archaeon]